MNTLLGNNRLLAVIGGGLFLIIAAILVSRVRDTRGSGGNGATSLEGGHCYGWNVNCNGTNCRAGGTNVRKCSRDNRVSLLLL